MPVLGCEALVTREPGVTSAPHSPQAPNSPNRQQFYQKFLDEKTQSVRPHSGSSKTYRVRNMVYANKQERTKEKEVCNYITTKVLNQGKLTRITGITTKRELEKQALAKKLFANQQAVEETERMMAELKKSEVFSIDSGDIE